MNVDLGIWSKLTKLVIVLLLIAVLAAVGILYLPLIKRNENYRKRNLELEAEIQKERELSKQLETSIDTLRRDPKAIERLVRERMGYAKTGETVVRFEMPATNLPPSTTP